LNIQTSSLKPRIGRNSRF